jgi:hypothetical protein
MITSTIAEVVKELSAELARLKEANNLNLVFEPEWTSASGRSRSRLRVWISYSEVAR